MARPNPELEALRAEVLRRQRAANNKVSRLKQRGIEIKGTNYDVRRSAALIKKYNTGQLNAYLSKLNSFTVRSNAFVSGHKGVPIPARVWRENVRQQRDIQAKGKAMYDRVKNYKLPGQKTIMRNGEPVRVETIKDRLEDVLTNKRLRGAGDAGQRPYDLANRVSYAFTSKSAVETSTKFLKMRNDPKFLAKQLRKQRGQLKDMLKEFGNGDLIKEFMALSDHQFNVAFNYTSLATEASRTYEVLRSANLTRKEGMLNDSNYELREILEWAKQLDEK